MSVLCSRPYPVLVFDFDGVILDSATLKRRAFAKLYDDEPEDNRRAVAAYLGRRGGQPREVKFRHIEGSILGRDASDTRIQELCRRFKSNVEQQLLEAPEIPGAFAFLERWTGHLPLYLLSATPESELKSIVEHRGLDRYFREVVGAPPDKATGLRNLLSRQGHAPGHTIMVGDSYNDYRAASSNGTHFIGVTADPMESPFPDTTATILDIRGLESALAEIPTK